MAPLVKIEIVTVYGLTAFIHHVDAAFLPRQMNATRTYNAKRADSARFSFWVIAHCFRKMNVYLMLRDNFHRQHSISPSAASSLMGAGLTQPPMCSGRITT